MSRRPRRSLLANDIRDLWSVDLGTNVNVSNPEKWFIEPNRLTDLGRHVEVRNNRRVRVK
ncbi:hypothetical protein PanWU01x14_011970, partial [Parasponia andersonii]